MHVNVSLFQDHLDCQDSPAQLVIVACQDLRASLEHLVLKERPDQVDSLVVRVTEV